MSVQSIAQAASIELYHRRFFPYYTFLILAGLDSEGKKIKLLIQIFFLALMASLFIYLSHNLCFIYIFQGRGAVYSYDPVGSFERESYRASGSGATLIQPFLDNQIGFKNQMANKVPVTLDVAMKVARDAFVGATERDIYTGDFLEMFVLTKESGLVKHVFPLKRD